VLSTEGKRQILIPTTQNHQLASLFLINHWTPEGWHCSLCTGCPTPGLSHNLWSTKLDHSVTTTATKSNTPGNEHLWNVTSERLSHLAVANVGNALQSECDVDWVAACEIIAD